MKRSFYEIVKSKPLKKEEDELTITRRTCHVMGSDKSVLWHWIPAPSNEKYEIVSYPEKGVALEEAMLFEGTYGRQNLTVKEVEQKVGGTFEVYPINVHGFDTLIVNENGYYKMLPYNINAGAILNCNVMGNVILCKKKAFANE